MFYVGQIISIEDSNSGAAGFFEIVGIAGTTLVVDYLNEGYNGAGAGIVAGKMVSPAGPPTSVTNPLPVANGGTGSATKAAAISALGVGQNATVANPTGLTQDITNSQTLIAGATVTAPAAGLYLVLAYATVAFDGVTFADRLITLRVRNTTSATTVAQAIKKTQSPTTAELPSYDFLVPFKTVSLAASDVLELQIGIDTVESAGDCEISEASIAIIPIALT